MPVEPVMQFKMGRDLKGLETVHPLAAAIVAMAGQSAAEAGVSEEMGLNLLTMAFSVVVIELAQQINGPDPMSMADRVHAVCVAIEANAAQFLGARQRAAN